MEHNICLMTDSYKLSHYKQYPQGTEKVFSYFECREGSKYKDLIFFGLQYIIKKYMAGQVVTLEKIQEAKEFSKLHFGNDVFNEEGWMYILNQYNGHLPIEIRAIAEGTKLECDLPLITVVNTDDNCAWLTNYLETLLVQVWYPITVATQSYHMKQTIKKYMQISSDTPEEVQFKLHDFGFRGVSSVESAGIGGCAHLVNFMGTDTLEALRVAKKYYREDMAGYSIPAAEHSTITSWNNEKAAYKNMLDQYPTGLVAVVSDSYNIYEACEKVWGEELKDQILNREGTLVIRPDSGEPKIVLDKITGILAHKFGFTTNSKGYKVLNPKVRIIQGDGITAESLNEILEYLVNAGWSADNYAFGSGGGLLQKIDRDTLRCAFKCSAIQINNKWQDVSKNPITDSTKKSKAGRLSLLHNTHQQRYIVGHPNVEYTENALELVFRNGLLLKDQTLTEIRERASQ